jgi:hypothetical protein
MATLHEGKNPIDLGCPMQVASAGGANAYR